MIWRIPILIFCIVCGSLASGPACSESGYSTTVADKYVIAKDWDKLLSYSQKWTQVQPNDPQAWFYLGNTYLNGFKRAADAIAPLRRAVALKPIWAQAWFFLGTAQLDNKQVQDAIASLDKATSQAPKNMTYWIQLGNAYFDLRNVDKTREILGVAQRAAGPTANFLGWFDLGLAYHGLRDYQSAATAYQQSLRLEPKFGDAWNNLGLSEWGLRNFKNAFADFEQAMRRGNADAAKNSSDMRLKMAMEEASIKILKQGGSGPSSSGGSGPSPPSCSYASAAACNAANAGEHWAADRIERGAASASEKAWHDR